MGVGKHGVTKGGDMKIRLFRRSRGRGASGTADQQRQDQLRQAMQYLVDIAPTPFTPAAMVAAYVKDDGFDGGLTFAVHDYGDNPRQATGDLFVGIPGIPNLLLVGAHLDIRDQCVATLHELAHLILDHPQGAARDGRSFFDSEPEKEAETVATLAMWEIDRRTGQESCSRSMRAISAALR